MCGITGFWDFKRELPLSSLDKLAEEMAAQIDHRGPDSFGTWSNKEVGLVFGHRRLSIRDLSHHGHQPMVSQSGYSVISYNGEIYNADELRQDLIKRGIEFRGQSDTEVILEACEVYGVEKACQQFIGMFAFSFWDRKNKKLFLVRDRLGIKPLYWGFQKGVLFFGSQLKSFVKHPHWEGELDEAALTAYFRFNYVPAPYSIYKGIFKLKPGSVLSIDASQKLDIHAFWDIKKIIDLSLTTRVQKPIEELEEELDVLLRDAVKRRMVADVPLGAFLSGGIDSSLIVALMQAQSDKPVKSFSIGFNEKGYNEAPYAAKIAKHLNTEHHELYLNHKMAKAFIPDIAHCFDEPFADVSQIPTYLVSKLAREDVVVSLSGDGGDELFAGYNRYFMGDALWRRMEQTPTFLKSWAAKTIGLFSPQSWTNLSQILPKKYRPMQLGDKLYKLAPLLFTENSQDFYQSLVSFWENPAALVKGGKEPLLETWQTGKALRCNLIDYMQYMDSITYLPDDILAKVDRASMAVGLEARVPYLDHRVVEFAWRLPENMKIRDGQGKWLLRQVLDRYVPRSYLERPKMGFAVPIDTWLRGSLREWAENLLSTEQLNKSGYLNPEPIRQRWQEHLSGKRNWQYALWGVLMFQIWREKWAK